MKKVAFMKNITFLDMVGYLLPSSLKALSLLEMKGFLTGWEEVRKLFLRLVDRDSSINFKSRTFEI